MFHKGQLVRFSKKGWEEWGATLYALHPSYTEDKIWCVREIGESRTYPILLRHLPYLFDTSELEPVESKPLILRDWI